MKWPNDLIWRGAKLGGLLVEGLALGDGRLACIVGIGVNCAEAPRDLPYPAATLADAVGGPVAPEALFARLALRFEDALTLWGGGAGFPVIRAQWLGHAAGLGGSIRIAGAHGFRDGIFLTLDEHGRLVLDGANGPETVEAGDLFLVDRVAD
jgi:BirA family biotin operon repressor/biotin-[acetyl-CoA-carboxylase] ligase